MDDGYKLFWASGTAALAPQMVLEELGLPYEIVEVDITQGEHRQSAYLSLNPAGTVPALVLPDGSVLCEAAAICLSLADSHPDSGLAPALDDPQRGAFLQQLFYLTNTVQVAYKRYYYPQRFSAEPGHTEAIRVQAVQNLAAVWRPVEQRLAAAGPWLLGRSFTLADLYMFMLATWYEPADAFPALCPAVAAAGDVVAQRPAVRRSLATHHSVSLGSG